MYRILFAYLLMRLFARFDNSLNMTEQLHEGVTRLAPLAEKKHKDSFCVTVAPCQKGHLPPDRAEPTAFRCAISPFYTLPGQKIGSGEVHYRLRKSPRTNDTLRRPNQPTDLPQI